MMPSTLFHEQITGSLFAHWADQLSVEVTTIYPGTTWETAELNEWLELWVTSWSHRPTRATSLQMIDVLVAVHIFSRHPTHSGRAQQLADAVRETLAHRLIPISNQQFSGQAPLAYLTLIETETRDLTRTEPTAREQSLQHLLVTCPGCVQQIPT